METLAERIARGPVSELDAIGWAIRLAKRLEALHAHGVAHGSVSPACVLTAGQDRNARAFLADVQRTAASIPYQSPERVMGGSLSAADDVWALAATLYALLTGQSPFAGSNDAEVKQKILAGSPAPLAVFDVGDDDLQNILERAFARDVTVRTASIVAFRRSLEEWHPDPGVALLPAIEDEEPEGDADDEARTMFVREGGMQGLAAQAAAQRAGSPPRPLAGAAHGAAHGAPPRAPHAPPPNAGPPPARPSQGGAPHAGTSHAGPPRPGAPAPPAPPPNALMADADDDEDDARTMMRALAPMGPNMRGGLPAPRPLAGGGGAPAIGRMGPPQAHTTHMSAVQAPAAHAAASAPVHAAASHLSPAQIAAGAAARQAALPVAPTILDEESGDDIRTVMRTPEAMAEALAAHARATGSSALPGSAATVALPMNGPSSPSTVALPGMDGAPLAYGAPPPSVGVRGPQAGTMMLPTMESGTEPMQPSPFGPGGPGAPGGRASQAVGHVPPPAGVAAFPASSLAMPAPGGAPGATATTAAMAPVGAPPSPVTSPTTGPDPQALAAAAEAQPAGWSLGKLAVAAVLALVLTAGLTFAILTLKGL